MAAQPQAPDFDALVEHHMDAQAAAMDLEPHVGVPGRELLRRLRTSLRRANEAAEPARALYLEALRRTSGPR